MKARHRIPTIFSIYMVDVLCCALGCVVLLWQVNFQEAEEKTLQAETALAELQNANLSVDALADKNQGLQKDLDNKEAELDALRKREVQVTLKLDATLKKWDDARKLALVYKSDYDRAKLAEAQVEALLQKKLLEYKDLLALNLDTKTKLEDQTKNALELALKLAQAEKTVLALGADLKAKKNEAALVAARSADQEKLLKKADNQILELREQLAQVQTLGKDYLARLDTTSKRSKLLEDDLDRTRKDLLDSSKRFQELVVAQELLNQRLKLSSKELEEAKTIAAALRLDKLNVEAQSRAIRLAAENRFAGITLTGRRIIFLVDMSGSMKMTEQDVNDPDKWPIVCDTVGKIMRSLPDLEQFQVIMFSGRTLFPLGNQGRWISYAPDAIKSTVQTLRAVDPEGETNMYGALVEAFRYRELGLDTIYLLSDGLPTSGEGLPTNADALSNFQRTEYLTKHIRQNLKSFWNRPLNRERVRINTIGFFFESPEVGAFLWALARENDGSFVGMSKP